MNWLSKLTALVLPYTCVLCHGRATDKDLCAACASELPWLKAGCVKCALPLENSAQKLCGVCQQENPHYDATIALFDYANPIAQLVSQFKFHQKLVYGKLFAQLLTEKLAQQKKALPQVLIPIPLHPKRLQERGYNQALELLRPIAKHFKIPIDYKNLQRTRATVQQSLIHADKRKSNVKNAFALQKALRYKHVGLVDDVMTTGHTVDECAKLLKRQGVEKVTVIVIARTRL